MARRQVTRLGAVRGVHQPSYLLAIYKDGNPARPVKNLNLRSVVAIQTSKSITDHAGTFSITLKDKQARFKVREMDVVRIRLRGHRESPYTTVLKGVVDGVRPVGAADPYGSREDTVIHGRCVGKYLQTTSLFLPVWDPDGALPTALTFGLGDVTKKGSATAEAGGARPYDIFRYIVRKYTYGTKKIAGVSGIPVSRHWLDHETRFSKRLGFQIPYLQFEENSVADALRRMEVIGFTETWIDELGRVVYRQPQWDAPLSYNISTSDLRDWEFPRTDVDVATYCEVIPAGDPGIDSGTAQALRAGRAPVPSAWIDAAETSLSTTVDQEFVIDTDRKGRPTEKGRQNLWYKRQRRLGLRPQQITSPLLVTQEQAQKHAEGLLRFHSRMTKGMNITIPGAPEVRLGRSMRVHGELEGIEFDRVFYIEAVQHDYVEGSHYTTSISGTHGRDRGEPKWGRIVLPKFDPEDLVVDGGILDPGTPYTGGAISAAGGAKGMVDQAAAIAAKFGCYVGSDFRPTDTDSDHGSNNATRAARDIGVRGIDLINGPPSPKIDRATEAIMAAFGVSYTPGTTITNPTNGKPYLDIRYKGYRVQFIWRTTAYGGHRGHLHIGARRL